MTTLTIPSSMTRIESAAFYRCQSLTTVNLASGAALQYIGPLAFKHCSSLSSFPFLSLQQLTTIEGSAFSNTQIPANIPLPGGIAASPAGPRREESIRPE